MSFNVQIPAVYTATTSSSEPVAGEIEDLPSEPNQAPSLTFVDDDGELNADDIVFMCRPSAPGCGSA